MKAEAMGDQGLDQGSPPTGGSAEVGEQVPPRWRVGGHEIRLRRPTRWDLLGYAGSVVGVALITAVIGAILNWHLHIANISMLYLLPVLALAALFGRGPAVLASLLAFLAFDFFFVPPIHLLIVHDPAELSSLLLLLVTALVTGQLTATLRLEAREAQRQQRRTATLYGLAQLIAAGTELDALLRATAERVIAVFASAGVEGCTVALPDSAGRLVDRAAAPPLGRAVAALSLRQPEREALAKRVLRTGVAATATVAPTPPGTEEALIVRYAPLRSGGRTVGVVGIAGGQAIRELIDPGEQGEPAGPGVGRAQDGALDTTAETAEESEPLVALFDAFCGQIALAIERAALHEAAVHAEALRESDRLKDALLSSVSHELRTPLASIKAITTSLLQLGMDWSEAARRDLIESIDTSVDRLNRLVSNLLDLSRLEAGVAAPQKDWHLIADIVATVLDRLDLAGPTRARALDVELPDDLPLVLVDHEQIEQVLTNLIENALKYSPADAPVRISAGVNPERAELRVLVADQGIGIPPAELDAIFDKFYRVQQARLPWASSRSPAGTGLGLAISRAIVRAHGGRIWAENGPERGATLTFTLPISSDLPRGELPEVAAPAATGDEPTDEGADHVQRSGAPV